ncbi:PA domain-containing protein [Leptospira limi]|uniref:Ig domain-containing protein n=1 Tax=Leptospira limi TaxID=2950023 RepID=A0ABT3LTZ6_9LEPT|nr:PA domain-containing protein [Leptospira limi]MCW7461202.1 putative Ig domain-containing protein [Leptospira limi]
MKKSIWIILTSFFIFGNCNTKNGEDLSSLIALLNVPSNTSSDRDTSNEQPDVNVDFSYSVGDIGTGTSQSILPTGLQPSTGVSFSVTPNLPAGLSINVSTGEISGTATSYVAKTDYDITGQKNQKSKTVRISFGISHLNNDRLNQTIPSRPIGPNYTYNVNGQLTHTIPADGCSAIQNEITGKIAIIRRGTCNFQEKVIFAQNAGAIAVIHYDNTASNTIPAVNAYPTPNSITIPSTVISGNAGTTLVNDLATFNTNATMRR